MRVVSHNGLAQIEGLMMYEIHKSDKSKGEIGKYQLLEDGICCGVFYTKMAAKKAMEKCIFKDEE